MGHRFWVPLHYAPTPRTPRPRRRTCNGRPLPRQRSSSHYAPTNTCSMQPACPKRTKPTSSNSCSTNHENLPHDIPTRDPHHAYTPSIGHNTGSAHTGTTGTAHTPTSMSAPRAPIPPTPPSVHRYHQPPATACPLRVRQRLPQTVLPCNPDHWVCLGAAHRLTHCPHCGDLQPHHHAPPAAPAAPPPASHHSFFAPLTDTLRDHLGGYYVADAAGHAWTIARATGSTPLPPHSPPLRHSGGGLNVAAHHVLLALYLLHCDLHLPDPQLPAPGAAAPTQEAWADTAPEEIAAYLQITCRRFNTALGRQEGTPYSLSALLYPAHHPQPTQLRPPEGWASFQDAHLAAPDEGHRHADGPHGRARLRQRPRGAPPSGAPLARPLPVAPTGTGGFTRPRHPPGQEDQDTSGGPPARPPAGRDTPTRARVQPLRTTPRPDPRGTPTAPSPPAPTTTTVPQHPNPAAQPATTARTRPHHARTTIRAEPGDMAPPTPPPRLRPS